MASVVPLACLEGFPPYLAYFSSQLALELLLVLIIQSNSDYPFSFYPFSDNPLISLLFQMRFLSLLLRFKRKRYDFKLEKLSTLYKPEKLQIKRN